MSFAVASAVEPAGEGSYDVLLDPDWSVGRKLHGGYLLALTVRAVGIAAGPDTPDPVAVSAQYFRPPEPGPAVVRTEVIKRGRTVSVLRAILEQDGVPCLEATVSTGRLDDAAAPLWAEPPAIAAEPSDGAVDIVATPGGSIFLLSRWCEVLLDPENAAFLSGARSAPELRLWARPRSEEPDLLFALLAGDISMPTTFNLGMFGWTPTVQLTALLRGHPAPGWLGITVRTRSVQGGWFDEDATVTDSTGRIVCQARQLALVPR